MDPEKYFRDDDPYKVEGDELENDEIQWQEIKEKLYNAAPEAEKLKQELQEQKYAEFEEELSKMINDHPDFVQDLVAPDNVNLESELADEDLKRSNIQDAKVRIQKDQYYMKREKKRAKQKRDGANEESVLWDDND